MTLARLLATLLAAALVVPALTGVASAQDALDAPDAPAVEAPAADELPAAEAEGPVLETPDDAADPADPPAADEAAEPSAEAAPAQSDEPANADSGDAAEEPVAGGEAAAAADDSTGRTAGVAIALAGLIVPILLGNYLAKQWKMPEQAWRISTVLTSLVVAGLCVWTGEFKGGPDLSGGITLVYELADATGAAPVAGGEDADAPEEETDAGVERVGRVDMNQLIAAIKQRVDPAGTREVSIRSYGGAVEIIIPKAGQADLEYIKRRITDLGQLEFRIVAD
ncbi:MAG: hypothetical protein AAF805_09640, partial [Planctomycetota bacterium]